ncbi:MAG: tRNA pseudouridine(55) synthase TruB [Verrucomicrobiota bacterium]|nr:tRNA pseudouridine(55) synthase TruB [Verrucomicrobiota bacterium]
MKGLLLVNKQAGATSFDIVAQLRRLVHERTIGHAGTLDPFATGVMLLLIGSEFTKQSTLYTNLDKSYEATLILGAATTTYDPEGEITHKSDLIPTLADIERILPDFQGQVLQTPPMFSAKKVGGKRLYAYAREGITVERKPILVQLSCHIMDYSYPYLKLLVHCSKGAYIRSLAHDMGLALGCHAHLRELCRIRVGSFTLDQCIPQEALSSLSLTHYLLGASK